MAESAPLPPFAAIVVAAGAGLRAGQSVPKQFALWRGKPLLRHSVERLRNAGADPLTVVIPTNLQQMAETALDGIEGLQFVTGGPTRQSSVLAGLESLTRSNPNRVLVHDAARPIVPREVIARLLSALADASGVIPVLPVVDSLAMEREGFMAGSADRDQLRRVQTPQAFHYQAILSAHRDWPHQGAAGDDAQVLAAAGQRIALVEGSEDLAKVTFAEDFMASKPAVRTGMGFDVHRLVEGEDLWLAGLKIGHPRGLAGHSDADVALHALVDAILGAIGDGDIGDHFPPSDPKWKNATSDRFLAHAVKLAREAGYELANADLTIICEAPKIGPHRDAMRKRVAEILQCDTDRVSIKATTSERLGFTGRGEGIAAQAIATLQAY